MKFLITIVLMLMAGVGMIVAGGMNFNQVISQAGLGFAICGLIGFVIRRVGQ